MSETMRLLGCVSFLSFRLLYKMIVLLRIVPSFPLWKPPMFPGRSGRVTDFSAEENPSVGCIFAMSVVNTGWPFHAVGSQVWSQTGGGISLEHFWLTFLFPFLTLGIHPLPTLLSFISLPFPPSLPSQGDFIFSPFPSAHIYPEESDGLIHTKQ